MDYEDLAQKLLQSVMAMHQSRPHKKMYEAMQGEMVVLNLLHMEGDEMLPGMIGKKMKVSSARVATVLNSLEKKGFITRSTSPSDRRKTPVALTEKGKDFAKEHRAVMTQNTANVLSLLGEEDAREYVRISQKLAAISAEPRE